ncbi:hypothetical protein FZI91_09930 [Mycobacterium sp. CBMA271]|uniref:hypothetical protein n=1 Tax=unclassified Mycobacteroides TaxID=2618759 RepID=UPI0012DEBCD0|nr:MULTISPECIES: hypothetical protein [unclassified Mycobacteroides]MUM16670.1 hypothetical protein [Mycobacteroides sp. CBMA 326]MUM22020.1 hypothetical protein [Mycobacteroides sp. CBMA 271]
MSDRHDAIDMLGQLAPRETARMAGTLAPTLDEAMLWLKRIHRVAAEFWDGYPEITLPLPADLADEVFTKISETTEDLTRHQLWIIFTDLGAYAESSTTSHLNNAHTLDNVARYTLNDIGTRLVPELLAHLQRAYQPRNTFGEP